MQNYLLKIVFIMNKRFNISRICVSIVVLVLLLINAGLIIAIIILLINIYEEGEASSVNASELIPKFKSVSISTFIWIKILMNLTLKEK